MLNHVAWVVEDQDGAVNFLVTYFACEAGPKASIEGPWADELSRIKGVKVTYVPVVSQQTATRIAVLKFETPPSADNKSVAELYLKGFRHIGFLVEDIDEMTARLKAGGYKFFSDVVTATGFRSRTVYFWGPEDVVIQLTESLEAAPPPHGS
jgi:hypothetical protein